MTFRLLALPPEVVYHHLVPLLESQDVISLVLAADLPITQQLYDQTFHTATNFDSYNMQMFVERMQAKVWTFGQPHLWDGRQLGDFDPVLHEVVTLPPLRQENRKFRRMFQPLRLNTSGLAAIVQLALNDEYIALLDAAGDLYLCLTSNQAPDEEANYNPFFVRRARAREVQRDNYTEIQAADENLIGNPYYSVPYQPAHFTNVSGGQPLMATDASGLFWVWLSMCKGGQDLLQGVPCVATDMGPRPSTDARVIKTRSDVGYTLYWVEERGIMVSYTSFDDANSFSWRNGYPCFYQGFWDAEVELVPLEMGTVRDCFAVGDIGVVWHKSGTVSGIDLGTVADGDFEGKDLSVDVSALSELEPFTLMDAKCHRLLAVSQTGNVVLARCHGLEMDLEIVQGLEDVRIAAVAVGWTHFLVLTTEGDVYSWGKEEKCNGCLGLGHFENAIRLEGVQVSGTELILDRPTKINLPGKVCDIAAGKSESCVLIYEQPQKKRKLSMHEEISKRFRWLYPR